MLDWECNFGIGGEIVAVSLRAILFAACRIGSLLGTRTVLGPGNLGLEFYEVTAVIHDIIVGSFSEGDSRNEANLILLSITSFGYLSKKMVELGWTMQR